MEYLNINDSIRIEQKKMDIKHTFLNVENVIMKSNLRRDDLVSIEDYADIVLTKEYHINLHIII